MKEYEFTCIVTGRGGHGAMPDKTIDPVVAAAALIQSVPACLCGGSRVQWRSIQGGFRFNVIPQQVALTGTLLAPDEKAGICRGRFEEGVRNIMSAFRTEGKLTFTEEVIEWM